MPRVNFRVRRFPGRGRLVSASQPRASMGDRVGYFADRGAARSLLDGRWYFGRVGKWHQRQTALIGGVGREQHWWARPRTCMPFGSMLMSSAWRGGRNSKPLRNLVAKLGGVAGRFIEGGVVAGNHNYIPRSGRAAAKVIRSVARGRWLFGHIVGLLTYRLFPEPRIVARAGNAASVAIRAPPRGGWAYTRRGLRTAAIRGAPISAPRMRAGRYDGLAEVPLAASGVELSQLRLRAPIAGRFVTACFCNREPRGHGEYQI